METRLTACPECAGDGGWDVPETGSYGYRYDPRDGGLITHWSVCRACDGKGEVEVEVSPITLDDLSMEEALRLDEEKLIAMGAYDGEAI